MTYETNALPLLSLRITFLRDRRQEFRLDDYMNSLEAPVYMPAGSCVAGSFPGIAHQSTIKRG
jgi:hypothetical protein